MQAAFLIIISLLGAAYATWTKQGKIALGLLILAIAFALQIPNLVGGIWVDVFGALSLILYTLGIFVVVWKKRESEPLKMPEEPKKPAHNASPSDAGGEDETK